MNYLITRSIETLTDKLNNAPAHLRDYYNDRIAQLNAWLFNENHNIRYDADAAIEAMIEWGTVER